MLCCDVCAERDDGMVDADVCVASYSGGHYMGDLPAPATAEIAHIIHTLHLRSIV